MANPLAKELTGEPGNNRITKERFRISFQRPQYSLYFSRDRFLVVDQIISSQLNYFPPNAPATMQGFASGLGKVEAGLKLAVVDAVLGKLAGHGKHEIHG